MLERRNRLIRRLITIAVLAGLAACSKTPPGQEAAVSSAPAQKTATPVQQEQAGIAWFAGTVDEAFQHAGREDKPIFLYWGAQWCPPCHRLKATVFKSPEFIQQSRLFVPVYLDGDTERAQQYGEAFGVFGYPTVILFNPQGNEVTRIPGGIDIEQYVDVLALALDSMRPVADLLRDVREGKPVAAEDWTLLAWYSWGQDNGRIMAQTQPHEVFRTLARACPDDLEVEKSRLRMLALASWAEMEERDPALAAPYLQQLQQVMANPALTSANIELFIEAGAAVLSSLAAAAEPQALQAQMRQILESMVANENLDLLTRIDAINGWAHLATALLAEGETMGEQQRAWLRQRVARAESGINSYQRQPAISTLSDAYIEAGLEAEARAMLLRELELSGQPYYFMSALGYLEKKAGNKEQAIDWYRQAWETSQGPATRFQWGTNYLFALIDLRPEDATTIQLAGETLFGELAQQAEGLHQRTRMRMDRLGKKLLEWSDTQQKQDVLQRLRAGADQVCATVTAGTEQSATCDNFLAPPTA